MWIDWYRVHQVAARADMHIVLWFCEELQRWVLMQTLAVAKWTCCVHLHFCFKNVTCIWWRNPNRISYSHIGWGKPGGQEQLNVDMQRCKIMMTGSWPEGLFKNQIGFSPFKLNELMASDGIIPGPLNCAVTHLNLPSAIYIYIYIYCVYGTWT